MKGGWRPVARERMTKKKGMSWHRIRRRVKGQPDPELYEQKKRELKEFQYYNKNSLKYLQSVPEIP